MKKRILALLLVVLMLGVCLVSCEDEKYGLLRYPPGSDDSTYLMMRDYENYKMNINRCRVGLSPMISFRLWESFNFVGGVIEEMPTKGSMVWLTRITWLLR